MENAKSLNLQEVVSENPEKILSEHRGKKRCEMGKDIGRFLNNLVEKHSSVMDFVYELGAIRNHRLEKNKK